ncbi:ATP-binding cassette domain-containing protein [Coprococcus sp. OM04-5BH]|uniref:ATP-binding cassette domain-containing protein n=1 Tax=Coprococcus sp. OM04-5BH TaxID=2293093 RepID=UPI00131403E7|nr:ATP-binding cassette domain-containing protein [Coprococcus sp. OM04-5BH]
MELALKGITKQYGSKRALDDFSYSFEEGVYGLLGPNGAGKSTLIKIITHSVKPTGGEITLDGDDIFKQKEEYRKRIGYMPQQQTIYPFYTGRQFLNYMGLLKGEDRKSLDDKIQFYLEKVNLISVADKKIGTYSGGMKQRLLIAQTFLGDPDIMIFDEPTAGLDPKERIHVRNLIHDNSAGKIIIVATHVVQDIESIADCIVLQKEGKVAEADAPDKLVEKMGVDPDQGLEGVYMKVFEETELK